MNKTKIDWVKNPDGSPGYTWNPITGCLNHVNGMCKGGNFPCYAYRLAHGRLKDRYIDNPNIALPKELEGLDLHSEDVAEQLHNPFYPRFWPERLCDLLSSTTVKIAKDIKPRGIFTCDMSDLFGIGIPGEWTQQVMDTIKACPQHRFYLLTKQPQNLIKFSPFPDNCWVGVTATDDSRFRIASIELMKVQAKVKYISFEPLLDWSDYYAGVLTRVNSLGDRWMKQGGINWLIIGAQTKPYKPPRIEWVREIVEAADKAGVPVFLKDNLWELFINIPHEDNFWEDMAHLRQEIPGEG